MTDAALAKLHETIAGRFEHPDWGSLEFRLEDGALRGRCGDLELALISRGTDRFEAIAAAGISLEGTFEVDGVTGRVPAVRVDTGFGPDPVRFDRVGE